MGGEKVLLICGMLLLCCITIFCSVGIYTQFKRDEMAHKRQMENYKIQAELYKCKLLEGK